MTDQSYKFHVLDELVKRLIRDEVSVDMAFEAHVRAIIFACSITENPRKAFGDFLTILQDFEETPLFDSHIDGIHAKIISITKSIKEVLDGQD